MFLSCGDYIIQKRNSDYRVTWRHNKYSTTIDLESILCQYITHHIDNLTRLFRACADPDYLTMINDPLTPELVGFFPSLDVNLEACTEIERIKWYQTIYLNAYNTKFGTQFDYEVIRACVNE